ncbi:MAG: hypothetical protein KGL39_29050 [Patescibacteria group bacterium]|nr:hypothetical protein [Patescibacteria group bacterium]
MNDIPIRFLMPADSLAFLIAVAVVQAWASDEMNVKSKTAWGAIAHTGCCFAHEFAEYFGGINFTERSETAGLEFMFDEEKAYRMSVATRRPATMSYGAQLGVLVAQVPNLSFMKAPESCSGAWAMTEDIAVLEVRMDGEQLACDISPRALAAGGYYGVVTGMPHVAMAAAGLGMNVVELYPEVHRGWLKKTGYGGRWLPVKRTENKQEMAMMLGRAWRALTV